MQSEAGAVAFVEFYFEQVNKAWMTPDDTLLPPLVESGCGTCANNVKQAEAFVADGTRLDGPSLALDDARVVPGAPTGQLFVEVQARQLPVRLLDSKGAVKSTSTPGPLRMRAAIIWQRGVWLMYAIADAR